MNKVMIKRRWAAIGAAGSLAVSLGLLAGAPTASAAVSPEYTGSMGYMVNGFVVKVHDPKTGSEFSMFGLSQLPGGGFGICLAAGNWDATVRTQQQSADGPKAAYVLKKYGHPINDYTNAAADFVLARKLGMNLRPEIVNAAWDRIHTAPAFAPYRAQFDAEYNRISQEVDQVAGPYSGQVGVAIAPGGHDGAVTGVGVKSGAGGWVAGVPVTLKITGPAVFEATGSATWSGSSAAGPLPDLKIKATGSGPVTVSEHAEDLPASSYTLFPAQDDSHQPLAAAGADSAIDANASAAVSTTYQPTGSSGISAPVVMPGQTVSDTVFQEHGKPGSSQNGTAYLWAADTMPQQTAAWPDGKPLASWPITAKYGEDGKATIAEPGFTVTDTLAHHYLIYTYAMDANADNAAVKSDYGIVDESAVVVSPTVTTTVDAATHLPSQEASDTAQIAGIVAKAPDGSPISYTLTGKGVYAEASAGDCSGVDWSKAKDFVTIPATPISHDGSYPGLGKARVDKPGCGSYGETLTITHAGKQVGVVTHAVGQKPQTFSVGQVVIGTTISQTRYQPGDSPIDTIKLNGAGSTPGTMHYEFVVAPNGSCPADDAAWRKALEDHSATVAFQGEFKTDHDGIYTTPKDHPVNQSSGCGTFHESWSSGGLIVETQYGLASETAALSQHSPVATQTPSALHSTAATPVAASATPVEATSAPVTPPQSVAPTVQAPQVVVRAGVGDDDPAQPYKVGALVAALLAVGLAVVGIRP